MLETINSYDRQRLITYYNNYCNYFYNKEYPITENNLKSYITVVYESLVEDIKNIKIEISEGKITIYFIRDTVRNKDTIINESPGGTNYMKRLEVFDEMIKENANNRN